MNIKEIINTLVSGLISGSLYAIMALGLTIIYGVIHVFNFGHGIVAVLGGYFTWLFLTKLGLGLIPSILLALVFMFFFGLLLFKATINPLLKTPNWEFSTIIFLLGMGILLENLALQAFGPRVKHIPAFFEGSLKIGFVRVNWHEISLIGIVLVFILILNFFLKKTWFGQAMRAVAQDMDGARIVGISITRIFGYAFAMATMVTGFSGILLGTKYYMTPHIGWDWMVKGFVIVVLGGLGSATGAVYAAFIMGIAEALATLYLGSLWVWPIWFLIFVTILLLRPQGLAGGRTL
ncbi:MAG: branched-chain amino acid ABC transporter permease [Desulfobacterales bacterium]|nr:MAG: branched-chain amino acid ABC transporter permease [Desulfobacterales bacterium]